VEVISFHPILLIALLIKGSTERAEHTIAESCGLAVVFLRETLSLIAEAESL
jgi:hypothetical protein